MIYLLIYALFASFFFYIIASAFASHGTHYYRVNDNMNVRLWLSKEEFKEFVSIGVLLISTFIAILPVANLVILMVFTLNWLSENNRISKFFSQRPFSQNK
jgi:hypothetical protein